MEARLEAGCILARTAVKIEHRDKDGENVAAQVKTVAGRVTNVELVPVQDALVAKDWDPRVSELLIVTSGDYVCLHTCDGKGAIGMVVVDPEDAVVYPIVRSIGESISRSSSYSDKIEVYHHPSNLLEFFDPRTEQYSEINAVVGELEEGRRVKVNAVHRNVLRIGDNEEVNAEFVTDYDTKFKFDSERTPDVFDEERCKVVEAYAYQFCPESKCVETIGCVVSMVEYSNTMHGHVEAAIRRSAVWVSDDQFVPDYMRTAI